MKNKTYNEHLTDAVTSNNKYALSYAIKNKAGLAWDNKKKKTMKSHMPRGKAFKRMEQLRWKQMFKNLQVIEEEIKTVISPFFP